MGFFSFCGVQLVVLVVFFGFVASTEPTKASSERRGLRNVIRVGKRYGDDELWEIPLEDKRYGKLMAFPRVGRSSKSDSSDDSTEKRSGSNAGMWFGPRIGRSSSKINKDRDDNTPWTYILLNSENPLSRHFLSNPRQDSEAEELNEYSDDFKEVLPSY